MGYGNAAGGGLTERQAEQRQRFEDEDARRRELFDGVAERILSPTMTAFAEELGRTGRWVGDAPVTEPRPSGSGIRSAGEFTVPGSVEGETRNVRMSVELYPTSGERFIAYIQVGDKVERKTFDAADFESDDARESADAGLRGWLEGQFDKLVRRRGGRF
ncbi:MAG TPA: hypothetical protein VF170_00625 [Planctomycetaceae bacterium]